MANRGAFRGVASGRNQPLTPDGVIDLLNDIPGIVNQFNRNCA